MSVDPLTQEYLWNSTYAFAENGPIENIDLDGAEKLPYLGIGAFKNTTKTQVKTINSTDVLTFTEFGTQYNVAEYATNLKDVGPFGIQYSRKLYFAQDKSMINNSDYIVGDGSIIKTKGTNWHFWMSNNDLSEAQRVTNQTCKGIGTTFFGIVAVGAALPAIAYAAPLASQIGRQALNYSIRLINNGVRKYGADFLKNSFKKYVENNGDWSKMDWWDITFSTVNPLKKYGFAGKLGTEVINSSIDIKDGRLLIVGQEKSLGSAIYDATYGVMKTTFKKVAGTNEIQDMLIDIHGGQAKNKLKELVGIK